MPALPLRPSKFTEFVGQARIVAQLKTLVEAAKLRKAQLRHVLLSGPPGLGKTTLASLLATEMKSPIKITTGPAFERPADLVGLLTNLEDGTILFIDEVHRLPRTFEELLYSAMEDGVLDILLEDRKSAVRINLPKFTLIAATTRAGMLSSPLLSRFVLHCTLEAYTEAELLQIATNNAPKQGIELTKDAALALTRVCRGTPRILNNILFFSSDYALLQKKVILDQIDITEIIKTLDITAQGLRTGDVAYLRYIHTHAIDKTIGVESLAMALNESVETLETIHEPFLIQQGYIIRTPQGRRLTETGKLLISKI